MNPNIVELLGKGESSVCQKKKNFFIAQKMKYHEKQYKQKDKNKDGN